MDDEHHPVQIDDSDLAVMDEAQRYMRSLVVSLKDGSMTEKGLVRPGGLVKRVSHSLGCLRCSNLTLIRSTRLSLSLSAG